MQAIPLLAGASAIATAAAFWALRRKPDAGQGRGDGLKANDQAHLCTAIDHAYDIIILFDRKGRILNANRAAEEAYGRTREELCRLHVWDIRLPQDLPIARTQLAQALRREGIEFETEHRRKDGTRFPVEVRSRTVRPRRYAMPCSVTT